MSAFSLSSNFVEFLSFLSFKRGPTPDFVFNVRRMCAQNSFGFILELDQMFFSYLLLACLIILLTLFLLFVYRALAETSSLPFFAFIHFLWNICLHLISACSCLSIGMVPFLFHSDLVDVFGTNFPRSLISMDLRFVHMASVLQSSALIKVSTNSSSHLESTRC